MDDANHSPTGKTTEEKVDEIHAMLSEIVTTFRRFLPMLERYERVSQANGVLAARKAMKQNGRG